MRVRGIAATAITRILLEKGHKIVQASEPICERLGIAFDASPAEVTVKDGDPDSIIVMGEMDKAGAIYEELSLTLSEVFRYVARPPLHSVHVGVVRSREAGTCKVELEGVLAILEPCNAQEGSKVLVSVERPALRPDESPKLTTRIRVQGKYVALIKGSPRISFSEHIRDNEVRTSLLEAALKVIAGSGLGVHFRSNSRFASKEEVINEIRSLLAELGKIESEYRESATAPRMLAEGEFLGMLELLSTAKERLDQVREQIVPTLRGHHSLKFMGFDDLVEIGESVIARTGRQDLVEDGIRDYIANKLRAAHVRIVHIKPSGERVELTPGSVHTLEVAGGRLRLVLQRKIKGPGEYDGLGIRKEPGDVDFMVVEEGSWFVSHNYYRGNEWLGTYVNVNAPPEIGPGIVKYHDLLVDVVVLPDNRVKVVDLDELEKYHEQGIVPLGLYEKAMDVVRRLSSEEGLHKALYRARGPDQRIANTAPDLSFKG
ncbi:MAG: DUF402 domain-containing protein [Desulfurococcaceae archaeon]